MYFKFYLFLFLIVFQCKPADIDFKIRPLQNTKHTGFVSRYFFQVIVPIDIPMLDMTIEEEREYCKKMSITKRDQIVLPLLEKIAIDYKNQNSRLFVAKSKSNLSSTNSTNLPIGSTSISDRSEIIDKSRFLIQSNSNLNRGVFGWFLDDMFLYLEDYSNPYKCTFIYRNITKDLFTKVEKAYLIDTEDKQR